MPTGGGYFFAPSVAALNVLAGHAPTGAKTKSAAATAAPKKPAKGPKK